MQVVESKGFCIMAEKKYLNWKIIKAEAEVYIESNAELYSYYQTMSPAVLSHAEGVAKIALIIGLDLGLPKRDLMTLGVAGLLHDIGKIFISSLILYKDGNLTDEEFEIMKSHPQTGAKLLQRLGVEKKIVDIVLEHHERLDGSGYPKGLEEGEIGYLSQIVTIADIFDALRHKRCYKEALSGNEAITELRNTKGLNKELVETFITLIHKLRL